MYIYIYIYCCSITKLCPTLASPWTAARQASQSFTISWSPLKLMSVELVMFSNHLIICHPLLLLPSIFPSIRIFSSEWVICIRCPKYWSFSFTISPSNGYSGLISFRVDWLDLLAVQGTLKSLLHHHSLKASILQCSVFFMVQLSCTARRSNQLVLKEKPEFWLYRPLSGKWYLCFLICWLGWS